MSHHISRGRALLFGVAYAASYLGVLTALLAAGWIDASPTRIIAQFLGVITVNIVLMLAVGWARKRTTATHDEFSADATRVAKRSGTVAVPVAYQADDDDQLHATYLTTAKLIVVDDEFAKLDAAERDAVLAHELAHRNHSTFTLAHAIVARRGGLMTLLLAFSGHGLVGTLVLMAVHHSAVVALRFAALGAARHFEHDADANAARIGLGGALARTLQRHASGPALPSWMSRHPSTPERVARLSS